MFGTAPRALFSSRPIRPSANLKLPTDYLSEKSKQHFFQKKASLQTKLETVKIAGEVAELREFFLP